MRKISLVFFSLMFFIATGCGSSTSGNQEDDLVITNPDYALIKYNGTIVIDTENSESSCEPASADCYGFATGYDEEERSEKTIISLAITDSSGHRFYIYFDSTLRTGQNYKYLSNVDFMDQDLRFYATYASPERACDDNCYNAYNYSDTVTCNTGEPCKSYELYVKENSEETLDFSFKIWNKYFLEGSESSGEWTFTGRIIIDKTDHLTDEELYYPRETAK